MKRYMAYLAENDEGPFEMIMASSVDTFLAQCEETVINFSDHQIPCLLAQWCGGRPTEGGGYEMKYGDKWYQRGKEPKCRCGLTAALAAIHATRKEVT
jgi:hypothetical protein